MTPQELYQRIPRGKHADEPPAPRTFLPEDRAKLLDIGAKIIPIGGAASDVWNARDIGFLNYSKGASSLMTPIPFTQVAFYPDERSFFLNSPSDSPLSELNLPSARRMNPRAQELMQLISGIGITDYNLQRPLRRVFERHTEESIAADTIARGYRATMRYIPSIGYAVDNLPLKREEASLREVYILEAVPVEHVVFNASGVAA
ncbi:MAG TPA: hypothetical protein VLF68_02310 [Candidatus Saccharimonadales bacterium]|nr:hypothetical protein [Candidatus Saccharimonadales bacterium]